MEWTCPSARRARRPAGDRGGAEPLSGLEDHYVAALTRAGWLAVQHTPSQPGEPPGILDDVVAVLPSVEYRGVTLDRSGEQLELSIMRDEDGTEVILLYLGRP